MQLYQRLEKLIEVTTSGNKAAFAKRLGEKPNTFLGYLDETGQEKIKYPTLSRIIETYHVEPSWLMIGEGPMFRDQAAENITAESTPREPSAQPAVADAIAVRVETVARILREAGAPDKEIRRAILMALAGAGESPDSGADGVANG